MAALTAAKRKKLPKSEFGEPGEDKYPMPDVIVMRSLLSRKLRFQFSEF